MQLFWLNHPSATEAALVGGKAAMLARLALRYRVPSGFCVVLHTADDLGVASAQQVIADAYGQLLALSQTPGVGVAVRSSAVDEDGLVTSFAGQHETVLNVTTLSDLLTAIEGCRRSMHSPQALAYRRHHGLSTDAILFGVLVQQMVAATSSAVVFSVDPVTADPTRLVVDSCWGSGDALVGGQITPDHIVLKRPDLTLVTRQIAYKPQMTQLAPAGITTVPVADDQQRTAALREEQVLEIARLALALEAEFGWPVDVECAYHGDQLYLLQCRPITTLMSKVAAAVTTSTQPAPVIDEPWTVGWDQPADGEMTWHGGRDFVLPLQQSLSLYYYQGWATAFHAIDVVGGLRARFVNGYEYRLWTWAPRHSLAQTQAAQRQREQAVPHLWATTWLPQILADLQEWSAVELTTTRLDELARHLQSVLTRQLDHWTIHAVMGDIPLTAVGRLVDWYLARFPTAPESEPYQLVQGQPNTSTEANHVLWELGQLANQLQLVTMLPDKQACLPAMFQVAFTDYCQQFGQLTAELQQQTLRLIQSYAALNLPDPNVKLQQLAAERVAFIQFVQAQLSDVERQEFDALLACALANNPLTESHNLYLDQMSDAATKRIIAEFARRLQVAGILADPSEIAYLSVYELLQWGYGLGNPLRPVIVARQSAYAFYRQLTPPPFIGKVPARSDESGVDRFNGPAAPFTSAPGTIRGIGAAAGVVRGRALVVRSYAAALALQPGDILVCERTDPTWTPLFVIAAGLVTDLGGSLSHAAVVAREYGLPAVVGTHVATQQIGQGQWIEVDGVQGIVRLL